VIDVAITNLTSPAVLAFVLAVVAAALGTSLRLPEPVTALLSTYLLLAIGIKGGAALRASSPGELWAPALATLVLGVLTPLVAFAVARRLGRFDVPDAAGLAAHYGSVSVVTFTAALAATATAGLATEGFMPSLVALLEVPGIAVALVLAHRHAGGRLRHSLLEAVTGKSILLLGGGVVVGAAASPAALAATEPLFVALFPGLLALYLLDLGSLTGERLPKLRSYGPFLIGYAMAMPLVLGTLGLAAGAAAGLSPGGAAVLAVMAASASYIAAPAAVSLALPAADPALSLTAALGMTFPFNLLLGIPLFVWAAPLVVPS
jgi:hypothetical protein